MILFIILLSFSGLSEVRGDLVAEAAGEGLPGRSDPEAERDLQAEDAAEGNPDGAAQQGGPDRRSEHHPAGDTARQVFLRRRKQKRSRRESISRSNRYLSLNNGFMFPILDPKSGYSCVTRSGVQSCEHLPEAGVFRNLPFMCFFGTPAEST